MNNQGHVWQQQDLAKLFLEDVRGSIPLATEQIVVLLRVVGHALPKVERVLDLGCGDGILRRAVLAQYPEATGVFLDFSEHMIEAGKQKADKHRAVFVVQDLAMSNWTQSVNDHAPFDLVESGLAIHHLTDERTRR
jgi:ubiquinone/menaquinone biosynthesis C-methylase UbiE